MKCTRTHPNLRSFAALAATCSLLSPGRAHGIPSVAPQVGPHEKIFMLEKNENPQNVLVVYTKLNRACHPESEPGAGRQPLVGYYWLMDHANYKPVNPMIQKGIRDRVEVEPGEGHSIVLHLKDLKELRTDIKDPRIEVTSRDVRGVCQVQALMPLGPSDGSAVMKVETIRTESRKTLLPPFRKVVSVTVEGENAKTGAPMKRTFAGR